MNKNTKIIFFQNLSHVIEPTRFPEVIYQGIVGLIRPGLETVVKNRTLFPIRGDLDLQYHGKLLRKSVLFK